ncbi:MAG TPA: SIMPL domain-containing protein [Anaerolineaceae bacterium]|nr:SIMPL domain-containing protein [Anaerolineaceae bacterium]
MNPISPLYKPALIIVLAALALGVWRAQQPGAASLPVAHAAPVLSSPSAQNACDTGRSIQVSGAAVVYVAPDRALLQLGVQSNGTTPDGTLNENNQVVQKVIAAVRGLGVEAKDIATDYNIVYPVYDNSDSLVIKGYRIDNTVSITLRDVRQVDDAILAAFRAGANEVQDVQFYTSELRKVRDQAREMAMKAAGEKAGALAAAAGAQTGCVLTISENTWSQYYGSWRGGRQTALWAQNAIQNAGPSQGEANPEDDSPISLGQIAVRAEINASYSLQ